MEYPTDNEPLVVHVNAREVLVLLMAAMGALAVLHAVFVVLLPARLGPDRVLFGTRRLFNLGLEANLPAFWSAWCCSPRRHFSA